MKIVCDFCGAEYTLPKMPTGQVKCAVCSHVWTPGRPLRQRTFIKFLSALCALLAVGIFFLVVMFFPGNKIPPLMIITNENSISMIQDKDGNMRLSVSGKIMNTTDVAYGVPDLLVVFRDAQNHILSRQDCPAPVTLLDSKTSVSFVCEISNFSSDAKRLKVELKESK